MFCLGKLSCPLYELLVMSAEEDSLLSESFGAVLLFSVFDVEHLFVRDK